MLKIGLIYPETSVHRNETNFVYLAGVPRVGDEISDQYGVLVVARVRWVAVPDDDTGIIPAVYCEMRFSEGISNSLDTP